MNPIFLYIKQHTITGLKYFGKTYKDPYVYMGSGHYWLRHIEKHGPEHVKTVWVSEPFTNKDDLVEFATFFSQTFNIVEDPSWANLMLENGINGGPVKNNHCKVLNKQPRNLQWNENISKALKGKTPKCAKKCSIDGLSFPSMSALARHYNVPDHVVYKWRKEGKVTF